MAARTETAWTVARTLDELRRYRRMSDEQLAEAAGPPYNRSTVSDRRRGKTAIDTNDMEAFGAALGVPATVFLMSAHDALMWVVEHHPNGPDYPSDQGITRSGWFADTADLAA